MNEFEQNESNAAAVIAAMERHHNKVHSIYLEGDEEGRSRVVALPPGLQIHSLKKFEDERLQYPRRIQGTAQLTTLDSFVEHVRRFADVESAIFAHDDAAQPSLTAIFDYHLSNDDRERPAVALDVADDDDTTLARWAEHRAIYRFPLSDSWNAWVGKNNVNLDQGAFAEFLEANLDDVVDPSFVGPRAEAWADKFGLKLAGPGTLLALARGLEVRVEQKVRQHQNLASGETSLAFEETHGGPTGGALTVPGAFVLGVPVFRGSEPFQLPARLRYRVRNGSIQWSFALHRADLVFQTAFGEACAKVREATELPVFFGKPESTTK